MKLVACLLLLSASLTAQVAPEWDTLCYQKYHSNLIVGIFQSYRTFENEFAPVKLSDSTFRTHNFSAESRLATGVEISYDKFGLAIALRSKPQDPSGNRGNSQTFGTMLRVGGNRWMLENVIRYFRGFYDLNTPTYDSSFAEDGRYFFQPDFRNTLLRSKFLYFTNHRRFSIRAGSVCNYRQVKSAASWVLSANISSNSMRSSGPFFPEQTKDHFGPYSSLHALRVVGIAVNAGGAVSVVFWRSFFVQFMLIAGPEQQWRRYTTEKGDGWISYVSLSGDIRGSIGLNFKKWYIMSFTGNDFSNYNNSAMKLENRSLSGGLIVGLRLNTPTPDFYKRFQETRLYKAL